MNLHTQDTHIQLTCTCIQINLLCVCVFVCVFFQTSFSPFLCRFPIHIHASPSSAASILCELRRDWSLGMHFFLERATLSPWKRVSWQRTARPGALAGNIREEMRKVLNLLSFFSPDWRKWGALVLAYRVSLQQRWSLDMMIEALSGQPQSRRFVSASSQAARALRVSQCKVE